MNAPETDERWQAYEDGYLQGASDGNGSGFGLGKDNPWPEHAPSSPHAELGLRAVKTAEIALHALERITALLDDDCDATRVALYNPKTTVAAIRRELEQASAALTAAERAEVAR